MLKFILSGIIFLALGLAAGGFYVDSANAEEQCGIENCHGLDIVCGPNVPEACTAMYALGDFCREFARCQVVDGKCRLVLNEKWNQCKACIEKCMDDFKKDIVGSFSCEGLCREK